MLVDAGHAHPRRLRRDVRLHLRLRVWAGSLALDRRLAEGASPAGSPELALRTQQLTSEHSRLALSRALIAAIDAASNPPRVWTARRAIAARGVLEAADRLRALARDLASVSDPPVRAVALVSFLLSEPSSPLYKRCSAVTVGELVDRARSELARAQGVPRLRSL